jgi:site-specific DNA-adenine methylase
LGGYRDAFKKGMGFVRRNEMADPIYKFWILKFTEAGHQMSEEEQNDHLAKLQKALEKVGGKTVITCNTAWSSEEWAACGVEEFPDIEAVQKHSQLLQDLGHYRYIESKSVLGTKWQPS